MLDAVQIIVHLPKPTSPASTYPTGTEALDKRKEWVEELAIDDRQRAVARSSRVKFAASGMHPGEGRFAPRRPGRTWATTISSLPRWVSMILRATVRPRPTPTLRVVKNGSEALLVASGVKPAPLSCTSICSTLQAVATGFHVPANADLRVGRVRLEGVKHNFSQRMLERCAVAGNRRSVWLPRVVVEAAPLWRAGICRLPGRPPRSTGRAGRPLAKSSASRAR